MPKKKQDYQVGYKKPPHHSQFKAGQSGNPKGRPKKAQTVQSLAQGLLRRRVNATIDGKQQRVSMVEAAVMKLITMALAGSPKAIAMLFDLLEPRETDRNDNLPALLDQFRNIYEKRVADGKKSSRRSGADPKNNDEEEAQAINIKQSTI